MPPGAGLLGGPDLSARLERWVADARSADSAAARTRERWLRLQADESATFVGVLVDLAEQGTPVVIHGRGGRRHRGAIAAVAADFCALRTSGGRDVLLAYSGIGSVRPDSRSAGPIGDRAVQAEIGMAEMLSVLAVDRPRVLIVTVADADGIAGELRSVGRDLVTVRLDGEPRAAAYVAITAIAEVSLV
ncbi:MAG: hypothetical protein QOH79_598 [Acidimicrobiaceae bacterium]